jgi:soluble lytic murein transglycosylase-like protein
LDTKVLIGAGVAAIGVAAALALRKGPNALAGGPPRKGRSMSTEVKARAVLPVATKWAKMFGCPPSLLMAIIQNESSFNSQATNLTGGDLKRGGAWGLAQLTLQTALALDKDSGAIGKVHWPKWNKTGPGLLVLDTNLAMAAYGIAKNWKRYQSVPNNWLVAGTAWNIGVGAMDKKVATAKASNNWTPITGHAYAQHIGAIRANAPLTAQLFAQEKSNRLFNYA